MESKIVGRFLEVSEGTKRIEKWCANEIKCTQDFYKIISSSSSNLTANLDAAIIYYRELCGSPFLSEEIVDPDATHEQFAAFIVDKLKLSTKEIIKLIEAGGPLYPADIEESNESNGLDDVRDDLIEKLLIHVISNPLLGTLNTELFDALLPLIIYIYPEDNQFKTFSWKLCAAAAELAVTKNDNRILDKVKKSGHWTQSYHAYVRVIQGDYSVFDTLKSGSWKLKKYAKPPQWNLFASVFYEEGGQKCLELHRRPQNVLMFDEIMRIYGPWHILYRNFKYLVNCVTKPDKLKQLRFFLTRPAHANSICGNDNSDRIGDGDSDHSTFIRYTSFAQLFLDKVKFGDHRHLTAFHSDFRNIEALCFDNSTITKDGSGANPTKLDKLFPKGLLVADESLLRLMARNIKFTLQSAKRLDSIRQAIANFHTALLSGEVIMPLRQLSILYF